MFTTGSNWVEVIPNQFWKISHVLPEDKLRDLTNSLKVRETIPVLSGSGNARQIETLYEFMQVTKTFFQEKQFEGIRQILIERLNEIFKIDGLSVSHELKKNIQMYVKYSPLGMRFGIHLECPEIHGPFAFVFYLESEDEGELVFFNEEEEASYLKSHPEESANYLQSVKMIEERGFKKTNIGPLTILPEANSMICFRTSSPHIVRPMTKSTKKQPRLNISGWPFCIR